ncbi:unnamed protein product [Macrosiphum euphorbiae]|uniref:Uncharacterized protein n=1 Tax=Macrosiphum euphorbiae TaxID=13131 RepID=A0AAV0WAC0_9HEMI|nr:unnamed protein product [Macrosiphum euphorbiae]
MIVQNRSQFIPVAGALARARTSGRYTCIGVVSSGDNIKASPWAARSPSPLTGLSPASLSPSASWASLRPDEGDAVRTEFSSWSRTGLPEVLAGCSEGVGSRQDRGRGVRSVVRVIVRVDLGVEKADVALLGAREGLPVSELDVSALESSISSSEELVA